MARKDARQNFGLECAICKSRNYVTNKNTNITKTKLTLNKYCKNCHKATEHNEYKLKS